MKLVQPLVAVALLLGAASEAWAQEDAKNVEPSGPVWSLTLAGGIAIPLGVMADEHQNAMLAGMRLGLRSRIGLGVELAIDYSPLPRRDVDDESFDTTYGTAALMPAWTLGTGVLRLQIAGGGGVALEQLETMGPDGTARERVAAPLAIGQIALHVHVTKGGGLVLLAGGTRTFRDREYQYAWGMGGLTLEF